MPHLHETVRLQDDNAVGALEDRWLMRDNDRVLGLAIGQRPFRRWSPAARMVPLIARSRASMCRNLHAGDRPADGSPAPDSRRRHRRVESH
jgi:hypothetical protein